MQLMVQKLVYFLSNSGVLELQSGEDHTQFFKHIRKIHKYLSALDKTKYLEPKFGAVLEPLAKHIKENCDSDQNSTLTSNISLFKNNPSMVKGDLSSLLAVTG